MNTEKLEVLVNNIIENEYYHLKDNSFENIVTEPVDIILKRLIEKLPKHKDILFELDDAIGEVISNLAIFYFKKGVKTGTTNLKFLGDIKTI
ncbi:hypothetical protein FDB23_14550 [Clostridium botulinum]|nr:hypothetical protein [Clostridium botulinum]